MGTVARHPNPASIDPGLPPGGNPQWDRDYDRWLDAFVARANGEALDRLTGRHGGLDALRDPINPFQVTGHLFKWLNGHARYPAGGGPNYNHRRRFVAIQFHHRRADLEHEAERYAAELIVDLVHPWPF
jgi:hypothetical protein